MTLRVELAEARSAEVCGKVVWDCCTCIGITNHFFSLTDTAASASAILLQSILGLSVTKTLPPQPPTYTRQLPPTCNRNSIINLKQYLAMVVPPRVHVHNSTAREIDLI